MVAGAGEDRDVAAARAAISERTGESPEGMRLIVRYEGRLVCAVSLPGRRVVFKAGPGDTIRLDAWASETARRLGVLAPAVLVVDTSRRAFPLDWLLMDEVPGGPLAGWPSDREVADLDLDCPAIREVLHEAGRQLRLLHSQRMAGFGPLDAGPLAGGGQPAGRWSSWGEYLADDLHANLDSAVQRGILPEPEAAAAGSILDERIGRLRVPEGVLLHGDFIARHLYVTGPGPALTGILDLGALSGDPAFDIAVADVDHRRLEPALGRYAGLLLDGYRPDASFREEVAGRLLLYRAQRTIGEAVFMHANGEDIHAQLRMFRWNVEHLGG
jgi:aminoglycoside phosphotransferase (APT) family kinase protein